MKKNGFFRSINCVASNQKCDIEVRLDPTDVFPDEIMLNIFKKLNFHDILHANAVSRSWCRLSNDVQIWSLFLKGLERVEGQGNQVEINRDAKDIKRILLISKLEKRKRVLEAKLNDLRNVDNWRYQGARRPDYQAVGPITAMIGFHYLVEPINHVISAFFNDVAKNKGIREKQNELVVLEEKIGEHQNSAIISWK